MMLIVIFGGCAVLCLWGFYRLGRADRHRFARIGIALEVGLLLGWTLFGAFNADGFVVSGAIYAVLLQVGYLSASVIGYTLGQRNMRPAYGK